MGIERIGLNRLVAHGLNSNVMSDALVEKLVGHIGRTGKYPPLIVRRLAPEVSPEVTPEDRVGGDALGGEEARQVAALNGGTGEGDVCEEVGGDCYQILDGHHRRRALDRLGHSAADCVVWEVDEEEALVLLATLNRLEGSDDPRKRGVLLRELSAKLALDAGKLAGLLPERREQVDRLLAMEREPPRMRLPGEVDGAGLPGGVPVCVSFFLLPGDRDWLEGRLKEVMGRMGGTREEGLMGLLRGDER